MTGAVCKIYMICRTTRHLQFLYRAPKIMLEPLSFTAVRKHYMDTFLNWIKERQTKWQLLQRDIHFAFQVLGYLYWENRDDHTIEDIYRNMISALMSMCTVKSGRSCQSLMKKILLEISVSGEEKVKEIREKLDMNSGLFSVYRDRLKRKGGYRYL